MIEKDLIRILAIHSGFTVQQIEDSEPVIITQAEALAAMKELHNKVVDECIENVDLTEQSYQSAQEGSTLDIDIELLQNLKIK